jgi:hypothetical protein
MTSSPLTASCLGQSAIWLWQLSILLPHYIIFLPKARKSIAGSNYSGNRPVTNMGIRFSYRRLNHAQKIEPRVLREIQSIKIETPCEFKITEFGLRRGNLAGVEVAWGKTEFMGKRAIIAATRDSGGAEKISVNLAGNPLKREGRRLRKK